MIHNHIVVMQVHNNTINLHVRYAFLCYSVFCEVKNPFAGVQSQSAVTNNFVITKKIIAKTVLQVSTILFINIKQNKM